MKVNYKIGQKFINRIGKKNKAIETITDIYKTFNSKNELVKIEYLTEHLFLDQIVTSIVLNSTIARSELID